MYFERVIDQGRNQIQKSNGMGKLGVELEVGLAPPSGVDEEQQRIAGRLKLVQELASGLGSRRLDHGVKHRFQLHLLAGDRMKASDDEQARWRVLRVRHTSDWLPRLR